jgi:hypothetical protein
MDKDERGYKTVLKGIQKQAGAGRSRQEHDNYYTYIQVYPFSLSCL